VLKSFEEIAAAPTSDCIFPKHVASVHSIRLKRWGSAPPALTGETSHFISLRLCKWRLYVYVLVLAEGRKSSSGCFALSFVYESCRHRRSTVFASGGVTLPVWKVRRSRRERWRESSCAVGSDSSLINNSKAELWGLVHSSLHHQRVVLTDYPKWHPQGRFIQLGNN